MILFILGGDLSLSQLPHRMSRVDEHLKNASRVLSHKLSNSNSLTKVRDCRISKYQINFEILIVS